MRKLDILVAEKVMGWHIVSDIFWYEGDNDTGITISFWRPSKSVSDALLCLERASKGRQYIIEYENLYWWCTIKVSDMEMFQGGAQNMALAICECSLRASGVSESLITQAME